MASYRHQHHFKDRVNPRFVKQGESNFAQLGLGQKALGVEGFELQTLEGKERCQRYLHAVVDDCWYNIRQRLKQYGRESLMIMALTNVEAVEFDRESWELTANALLAVHRQHDDVIRAASLRELKRNETVLASRVIAEMAMCECPLESGRSSTLAAFDELLGLVKVMVHASYISDAIRYDLAEPKVAVLPNGEHVVNQSYAEDVIGPYMSKHFSQNFRAAASSYEERFETKVRTNRSEAEARIEAHFEEGFGPAFEAEYGVPPMVAIAGHMAVQRDAVADGRYVTFRTRQELQSTLVQSGMTEIQAQTFLNAFLLNPREQWNKAPDGYIDKDWYPWRFRRKLSVIARPFLRLSSEENSKVIFAPALVDACFKILFSRLLEGHIPDKDFRSSAMRSWIGKATRENGIEFEEAVAKEIRATGMSTLCQRPMTEFGADESYGDIGQSCSTRGTLSFCGRLAIGFISAVSSQPRSRTIADHG